MISSSFETMPDLFGYNSVIGRNLLPRDGHVQYFGRVLPIHEADQVFEKLLSDIEWFPDQARICGKLITTKRKVAWYGDRPYEYTYSGVTKKAAAWPDFLIKIKRKITDICQTSFNSCLLNLYHTGAEGMAWHSDAEKDLRINGVIASVSFGAERIFQLKHSEKKDLVSLWLEHGSLLVMKDTTQSHWLHCVPKAAHVKTARISLTFRQMRD